MKCSMKFKYELQCYEPLNPQEGSHIIFGGFFLTQEPFLGIEVQYRTFISLCVDSAVRQYTSSEQKQQQHQVE